MTNTLPSDVQGALATYNLQSEIINKKKQFILKIDQTSDFVYPNEKYKYQIYCKNISGSVIEDVHIQIINPENVLINEDETIPPEGIPIGNLKHGESQLLYLDARCSTTGYFTVHVLCFGKQTGLFTQKLNITCNYDSYNNETIHKIHFYNFSPYEEAYKLRATDYNDSVTQLHKIQKLPYKAKQNPFKSQQTNINNGFIIDESQSYIDQKRELYGDDSYDINNHYMPPYRTDEHVYQYIGRENFNKGSVESYEGKNLIEILNQINDNSKLFKAIFLKTGNNELLNDFTQYSPDGFIYRFGLMNSEIFHHLGVLPEYSFMNDYLFRWAPDENQPLNLYPKKVPMIWDTKKWAGHGWNVWKTYTDEYRNEIINTAEYIPLFEFVHNFENEETAQQFIEYQYANDISNQYYITIDNQTKRIRKYQYIIKESYFDSGVFYVHIPLNKIPSNFYLLNTEEIEAIIQRTKPFGMKPLIRYVSTVRFNHELDFKTHLELHPHIPIDLGEYEKLTYYIQPYKYNKVIETICSKDSHDNLIYKDREVLKLIPDGRGQYNGFRINLEPDINLLPPQPKFNSGLNMELDVSTQQFGCDIDNNLTYLSEITELLYQNNFDAISFSIRNLYLRNIQDTDNSDVSDINAVDYKLWTESLYPKNDNTHSAWWDLVLNNQKYYINGDDTKTIDFMEIPLTNIQLTRPKIESGIGFEDSIGKLHGISAEYNEDLDLFEIKYTTSLHNNFKIKKHILSDITGLAYKIIQTHANTLIIFFIKKTNNEGVNYYYFHHVITPTIKSIFCFTRNTKDISTIKKWSNLINIGSKTDPKVRFNTPQYYDYKSYDPNLIITDNINAWQNITRIDKNEHSYAVKHNNTDDVQNVDNILLHYDNLNLPRDAVIKNITLKTIVETNTNKTIYHSFRNQDGFITTNSDTNTVAFYPDDICAYPHQNKNTDYYTEQYNIAVSNNVENSAKFFKSKILENELFDEALDYSTAFLNDINDYIEIYKSYWIELSNFTSETYSFNNIEQTQFIIEGYNYGSEVYLSSQLEQNDTFAQIKDTKIPSGYFYKIIDLKNYNKFTSDNVKLRFRFKNLNDTIEIFDAHLDMTFNQKQETIIDFNEFNSIDIENKKIVNLEILNTDNTSYNFNNGLTVKLEFDDLEPGEYYRIYSVELKVAYQKQSIDFLINSNNYTFKEYENNFLVVSGKNHSRYICGMFFDSLPSISQLKSTSNAENIGIEFGDALYQSFIANADNITSVTIYPNGFIGNPDTNIKIGLYTNEGNTPSKLIKEINANGWSKSNDTLKNATVITYNFNVNNLNIGAKYWLKFEIENPQENNYYLLKYIDTSQPNLKLLTRYNNNLINVFGALKFQINSINLYNSFNNIPISQNYFNNPNIFISINKADGYIDDIKVRKYTESDNIEYED